MMLDTSLAQWENSKDNPHFTNHAEILDTWFASTNIPVIREYFLKHILTFLLYGKSKVGHNTNATKLQYFQTSVIV